ncbi:hypothetical protein [Williamsia muralis]|uniref:hypothetical protein n=1 Tax=Williamsia marianensis TaxID=85044 RepID=UPI0007884114|nr:MULTISPECIES: hypothetical protein [Williamsia]PVY27181.1 hypothetical protein C7458_11268 [Williamsia marianensis]
MTVEHAISYLLCGAAIIISSATLLNTQRRHQRARTSGNPTAARLVGSIMTGLMILGAASAIVGACGLVANWLA